MKAYLLGTMCLAWVATYAQTPVNVWEKQVDQAAVLIKTNPDAAEDAFETLLKGKNKKNPDLLVDIGEAYLEQGDLQTAKAYAERAKEVDSRCADAYVLSGDVAMMLKDVNQASGDYNQAIYLDEDCHEAYLKYADVYQTVNPQLSIDMLLRLQTKIPDDARVDRQLGEIYFGMGENGKAIESYDEYMEAGTPGVQDYTRYATLLYLNKEFGASLKMVRNGLDLEADNPVLQRLSMYNHYELSDWDTGLEVASQFFEPSSASDYVYLDYMYYGRLLRKKQQYDDALEQFHKALELDSLQADIYKELSTTYEEQRNYPQAITAYEKYLEYSKDEADAGEIFLYGRLNYYAAADSTWKDQQMVYLSTAEVAFAEVMERSPDVYLGSFWRARTNSLIDPETTQGLAKPYYEAALAILEQKPDASVPLVVECLSYLGYYYFVKEDYDNSKLYWSKILTIDPENETAKAALEGIK